MRHETAKLNTSPGPSDMLCFQGPKMVNLEENKIYEEVNSYNFWSFHKDLMKNYEREKFYVYVRFYREKKNLSRFVN